MIDFVFTLDYEIYGNGVGSLRELVLEPTEKLRRLFKSHGAAFVVFAEAAEFEKIEELAADDAIHDVRLQLRQLYDEGFEIGLHLHPQWYNALRRDGTWRLDPSEYNLCTLPAHRIDEIVARAIRYLRNVVRAPGFTPVSFRAGNWLMQPTGSVAGILSDHGIRIDSSVFKGGFQRAHSLDYRPSLKNGYHWRFAEDVNRPNPSGALFEVPIYTDMQPFWKMIRAKRIGLQKRTLAAANKTKRMDRMLDFARFAYPRKLDFCRMTYDELRSSIDQIVREDKLSAQTYRPVVAIGHSKDLVDFDTVARFLSYLDQNRIAMSTFAKVFARVNATG